MEIFSEIYGVYYKIVEEILQRAPVDRTDIQHMVADSGFAESILHLIPKLLDERAWPLLHEADGKWHSRLRHTPAVPVTLLEKRWLKAILQDPRARLFLPDNEIIRLNDLFSEITPLFELSSFNYFDKYLDGDDYLNEEYISHFRQVIAALHNHSILKINFRSGLRGKEPRTHQGDYLPMTLEYSEKDDKFRAYCLKIHNNKPVTCAIINLGRIVSTTESTEKFSGLYDLDAWFKRNKCSEPVVVEVSTERNAVERFLVEFSSYEKQSSFDDDTSICTVNIWYPKMDETEVLIRILSFGPVVKVIGPSRFVDQIRHRICAQNKLLNERNI